MNNVCHWFTKTLIFGLETSTGFMVNQSSASGFLSEQRKSTYKRSHSKPNRLVFKDSP